MDNGLKKVALRKVEVRELRFEAAEGVEKKESYMASACWKRCDNLFMAA
jgi:hypothetical protein